MTRNSDCPAFEQLWALVSGKLDADAIHDINRHLATCPDCQGQVQQLQADSGKPVTTVFQAPASSTVAIDRSSVPTSTPEPAGANEPIASVAAIRHEPNVEAASAKPTPDRTSVPTEPKAAVSNGWKGPLIGATAALLVVGGAMLAWQIIPGLFNRGSSPEVAANNAANNSATGSEAAQPAQAGGADPANPATQAGPEGSRLLNSNPLPQQPNLPAGFPQKPPSKLQMGDLDANLPIESIKVSLTLGEGEPRRETVDLHLGLGFPLRLQVAPASEHKPGFAAFPQTSSQTKADSENPPGTSAWYEFNAKPSDNGFDELARTPQLLRDLRVGDISTIGFASTGEGDWILSGYKIEINGKLFAENSELERNAGEQHRAHRQKLDDLLERHLALVRQLEDGQASAKLGLTDSALSDEDIDRQLARSAAPVNDLSGIVTGAYPWYSEPQELFATKRETSPISSLIIRLNVAPQPQSGSQNPIYFDAKGKKYLLSGEADPLVDDQPWQVFQLREQDLSHDPLWHEDLRDIGIGMLGSELSLGQVPDRAAVARVVVEADRAAIYDS
jgi:anti-sigma factor RsiW